MSKRKLDSFFSPISERKKSRNDGPQMKAEGCLDSATDHSRHITYPFPIPFLPQDLQESLNGVPASDAREINDQPDLDLLYFEPFIPPSCEHRLFAFLRQELFFYRVKYKIKRGGFETDINTPRFTTVFGVDTSARFTNSGELVDSQTGKPAAPGRWNCVPRPLPQCLDHLKNLTEAFTGATYNFCLVNYYANGSDSISYHSDDERFLGPDPAIASFSLGATRDFCMKHKPALDKKSHNAQDEKPAAAPPLKLPLGSGDMVLMRGKTQSNWLHSIPKRKGKGSEGGRINITFRKGVKQYATENYMQYNVGDGCVYKWNSQHHEMKEWKPSRTSS